MVSARAYDSETLARIASLCEADPEREVCGSSSGAAPRWQDGRRPPRTRR